MKNRMAAQHARDRKKVKMLDLEGEVKKLSKDNEAHLKRVRSLEEQVRTLTKENNNLRNRVLELEGAGSSNGKMAKAASMVIGNNSQVAQVNELADEEEEEEDEDTLFEVDQWLANEMNSLNNRSSGTFESAELISASQQKVQVLLRLLMLLSNLIPEAISSAASPLAPSAQVQLMIWAMRLTNFLKSSFPASFLIASIHAIRSAKKTSSTSATSSNRQGRSILRRNKKPPASVTLPSESSNNLAMPANLSSYIAISQVVAHNARPPATMT